MSELDRDLLNNILGHNKLAYAPPNPVAPAGGAAPPMPADPAMAGGMPPAPPMPADPAAGGMPPMDPAMMAAMGGGMPMDPAMMGAPPMDPAMMGMDPAMMGMDPAAMGAGADPLADPAAGGAPEEMSPDTPVQMTLEDLRSIFTEIVTGEPAEPSEPEGPQDVESRLANIEDMLSQLVGGPEMAPPGAPPAGPDPMAGAPPELTEAPGEPAQNMAPGMEGFAPEVQKMASYEERMSAADWDERNRITQLLAKLHRAQ